MSGRIGCGLCVVHDRLYVSGGVDEITGKFDASVACWSGERHELFTGPQHKQAAQSHAGQPPPQSGQPASGQGSSRAMDAATGTWVHMECRPWRTLPELEMPLPMHAHSAITVPMLPADAQQQR